jgi:hypothetical protein
VLDNNHPHFVNKEVSTSLRIRLRPVVIYLSGMITVEFEGKSAMGSSAEVQAPSSDSDVREACSTVLYTY